MLITNFASGELSENLFGRIDLPQYFQGVSRLENFDVVPTGGIKRRNGLRRITELGRPGRIIPFIVDRENSYLLYLSPKNGNNPARITVYTQDGKLKRIVDSTESFKLFQTMDVINQVQYAQNFDVMILCHEDYNPVEVTLVNENLTITPFLANYTVEVLASENIKGDWSEPYEDDYLRRAGNYPRAVTFCNGRLFFAGIKTMPQRIFASKVGDIHEFSTYKKAVTERREYLSVYGSIVDDDDGIKKIRCEAPDIAIKFIKPPNEYYVDSPFFQEGARIESMIGDLITITGGFITTNFSRGRIEREIVELQETYAAAEEKVDSPDKKQKVYKNRKILQEYEYNYYYQGDYLVNVSHEWYIRYGVNHFQIEHINITLGLNTGVPIYTYSDIIIISQLDNDGKEILAKENITNIKVDEALNKHARILVKNQYDTAKYESQHLQDYKMVKDGGYNGQNELDVRNYMINKILNTMRYNLHNEDSSFSKMYYNYPDLIDDDILPFLQATENIYISFYTKDYVIDRYPSPDDGFTFEIASDMSDAIKWIGQNKNLIVGTETGEWIIPAGVHATNIQAVLNSRYGSDNVQGTAIGDAFCFVQTGKKAVVEYYIPQQDNNFRANNMAMLSKNMLGEAEALDFDFASAPYTIIFILRDDGAVVCLLYERMTGTFAWSRITTRNGDELQSVAVLPGDGGDETYFVVKRGGKYYLERLDGRDEVYLDSFHAGAPGTGEMREGAYSGFPYTSRVRSMPVLANDKMKNQAIKRLTIRFLDSFLPRVKSVVGVNREVQEDTIAREEPYSGVISIAFPGQYDRDVFFEFVHDKPTRCQILAVNAEAN